MADATIPSKLEVVEFYGDTLLAVEQPDGVYVAVLPICRALGVSPAAQMKVIQQHPILADAVAFIAMPFASSGQDMVCLKLDFVHGWLFGIDSRRVAPEARDKVLTYQRECFAVLFAHFHSAAARGEVAESDVFKERRALVAEVRLCFGERAACALYIKLGLPTTPEFFRQGELAV